MKSLLFVSLLVLTMVNIVLRSAAQTPALQQGVSVQMAVTSNAQPMLAADNQDAMIIAVTADGRLFFGVHPESAEGLMEQMKKNPRQRDQTLYIKADAHARFVDVKKALMAAQVGEFTTPVLLTMQHEAVQPGSLVPPKGIAVGLRARGNGEPIIVRISSSAEGTATLTVNDHVLPWSELESKLKQQAHSPDQIVQVEANDAVSFADLIRVLDEARATGAMVSVPIFRSL
ncbi:MAG: biopolymer transporter ExbD [Candidatus Sulfotelmatobacter sp.]